MGHINKVSGFFGNLKRDFMSCGKYLHVFPTESRYLKDVNSVTEAIKQLKSVRKHIGIANLCIPFEIF